MKRLKKENLKDDIWAVLVNLILPLFDKIQTISLLILIDVGE